MRVYLIVPVSVVTMSLRAEDCDYECELAVESLRPWISWRNSLERKTLAIYPALGPRSGLNLMSGRLARSYHVCLHPQYPSSFLFTTCPAFIPSPLFFRTDPSQNPLFENFPSSVQRTNIWDRLSLESGGLRLCMLPPFGRWRLMTKCVEHWR